jgi:hypothetical protein
MINLKNNPVQWSLLLYELEDAQEHLGKLIDKMSAKGEIDEIEYQINLGHIYSHLNRAWNSRNRTFEENDNQFEVESQFPKDIRPV